MIGTADPKRPAQDFRPVRLKNGQSFSSRMTTLKACNRKKKTSWNPEATDKGPFFDQIALLM